MAVKAKDQQDHFMAYLITKKEQTTVYLHSRRQWLLSLQPHYKKHHHFS